MNESRRPTTFVSIFARAIACCLVFSPTGCALFKREQPRDPFLEQAQKAESGTLSPGGTKDGVRQASYNENPDVNSEVISDVRGPDPEGWEKWAPENVSKTIKAAVGLGPDIKIARPAYEKGRTLFGEKKYKEAVAEFATAVARWPDSTLEEDALFMQAESYFFADEYTKAEDTYQMVVEKYSNTRYLDTISKRLFSIAKYWQDSVASTPESFASINLTDDTKPWYDTMGHAIRVYEKIRLNDPRGVLADDSVMAAANLQFLMKDYEEADHLYNIIRTDYTRSEFLLQAHKLGLQCKLQLYQGADYDKKALEDAEVLVDQLLVQFPREVAEDRERLLRTKAELKAQTALRDWNVAQYYERGGHNLAAKITYQKLIQNFPGTEFAERSKTQIAGLQGKPDNPPDRFGFLDYIFPNPAGKYGQRK